MLKGQSESVIFSMILIEIDSVFYLKFNCARVPYHKKQLINRKS